MKYKTVYDLFDDVGYVDGVQVKCGVSWYNKTGFKKADRLNPYDFEWGFVCADLANLKLQDVQRVYDEVVYTDCTLEVVVLKVKVEGETYLIKFTGNYSSWSDTEYYRDPVFCKPVEVTRIEYQTI